MDNLLTPSNLMKGLKFAIYLNIIFFIGTIAIHIGFIYSLHDLWNWEHLIYVCIFYSTNLSLALLTKNWYEKYLQRKNPAQIH